MKHITIYSDYNYVVPYTFRVLHFNMNVVIIFHYVLHSSTVLHNRYRCNFGPEDKSDVVQQDMQALLKSTQKKRKKKVENKKKGKKIVPAYDAFPTNNNARPKATRISKTQSGNSIKRGCQRCFLAKKPYLDHSLCLLVYENTKHLNAQGEHCHGSMVTGFRYALGSGLSEELKLKIAQLHALGLSPTQIMQQHTKEVRDLAMSNGVVTRDTFLLPSDVRNICRKRAEDLWEKHPKDPISVRMWTMENPENVFYYQEHGLMDLNSQVQDDSPFTLGIQTEWQLQMMAKFGFNNALSVDATFGTSQTRVSRTLILSMTCPAPSIIVLHVLHCLPTSFTFGPICKTTPSHQRTLIHVLMERNNIVHM